MRVFTIAFKKIKSGNIGAGSVFFFAAVLAFTFFAGRFLTGSLSKGTYNLKERLGADIAVVPRGEEGTYQGILLSGEPVACTLERSLEQTIRDIDGVDKLTPVIFLASLNASCCSVPIQIIGYEPETDFVTSPWISEEYSVGNDEGNVIVGCNIAVDEGNELMFFGRTYQVRSRLLKTGTGMDKSVYVTFDVMEQMIRDAREKGITFDLEGESRNAGETANEAAKEAITDRVVSAFLIRVKDGADPDSVAGYILRNTSAGVVQSKNVLLTATKGMDLFAKIIAAVTVGVMLLVIAVTMVLHVFRTKVRRKEWAVFLMMGASERYILSLILAETLLLSLGGAIVGIAAAAIFVFPFQELIATWIALPFYAPGAAKIAGEAFFGILLTLASGILPGVVAGVLAMKTDCYELMREGEC